MNMKEVEIDVLVVGSGLAGVMAALKATHMGCSVILTSKVTIKSGNTIFAGGGWFTPSEDLSPDGYFRLVMEGGKNLNDVKLVQVLTHKGQTMVRDLEKMGVPMERKGEKYWYVKAGTSIRYPGDILMEVLLKHIKDQRIIALPWTSIFELLLEEGQAVGALAFSRKEGLLVIHAKSVVLATGGAGNVYKRNDNHRAITGDGYWLAAKLGLPLKDMEFIQFYPIGLSEPGFPSFIIQPPIPKEARIINSNGEDIFQKYALKFNLAESVMEYRDEFTLVLTRETEKETVYMDCTQVPAENWNRFCLNQLAKINPAFRDRPFAVAPVVHFFMGGIEIDQHAGTKIPGLFAAGEVTSGVHGANRMGGNALTECTVFGHIAGESAARYALNAPVRNPKRVKWRDEFGGGETSEEKGLFKEIQEITWSHAGPIRNAQSLEQGLARVAEIRQKVTELERAGRYRVGTKLQSGLLVSQAIMKASQERKESRGAFYREDFGQTDDDNWLKHILLKLDPETGDLTVIHQ